MFVRKIFLANSFVWQNNCRIINLLCPRHKSQRSAYNATIRQSKMNVTHYDKHKLRTESTVRITQWTFKLIMLISRSCVCLSGNRGHFEMKLFISNQAYRIIEGTTNLRKLHFILKRHSTLLFYSIVFL